MIIFLNSTHYCFKQDKFTIRTNKFAQSLKFTTKIAFNVVGYYISVFPTSFPVGAGNVTIQCRMFWWYTSYRELTLDIRQNENEDFISVIKCNDSGIYRLNNETQFKGVTLLSYRGDCSHSYYDDKYILLTVSLQSDKCAIDSQMSASTRCLFSNNAETFNSSERDMYSIKGIYMKR